MPLRQRSRAAYGDAGVNQDFTFKLVPGGVSEWVQTYEDSHTRTLYQQSLEDVVGQPEDPTLAISSKITRQGGVVNGSCFYKNRNDYRFYEYPIPWVDVNAIEHLNVPGAPNAMTAANEVMSRTNPNKPQTNFMVSLAELRELPKMAFRKTGQARNSVVENNFGWDPLIRDIRSLFAVPQAIEQRIKSLRHLGKNGGARRSRTLWSGYASSTWTNVIILQKTYLIIYAHPRVRTTRKSVQATINWKPSFDIGNLTDEEMWKLAARSVSGLDPQNLIASAYELLPWSWLIDYFSNLGDMIALTNNSVASLGGPVSVSTVTETHDNASIKVQGTGSEGISVSPIRRVRRNWTRDIVWPLLQIREPIITHGQQSTLNSLIHNWKRR